MNENYRENFDRIFRGIRPKPQEKEAYSCIMEPQEPIILKSETLTIEAPQSTVEYVDQYIEIAKKRGSLPSGSVEAFRFQFVQFLMERAKGPLKTV